MRLETRHGHGNCVSVFVLIGIREHPHSLRVTSHYVRVRQLYVLINLSKMRSFEMIHKLIAINYQHSNTIVDLRGITTETCAKLDQNQLLYGHKIELSFKGILQRKNKHMGLG